MESWIGEYGENSNPLNKDTKGTHPDVHNIHCIGRNGMMFGISGTKWTIHNIKVQRCKPLEILTLETLFCSIPFNNHCNTLSHKHKLTQSPNYNMGMGQTLVQIFSWSTSHQNYLWQKSLVSNDIPVHAKLPQKVYYDWQKYRIFGKNGLTVIPNCHCNKKLKMYFHLEDFVAPTGKICAVSRDLRLLSNNLSVGMYNNYKVS